MPRGTNKSVAARKSDGTLSKYMPGRGAGNGYHDVEDKADWAAIHPDYISAAVVSVNRSGGAVLFGGSRDETQFAITLFFGGEKNTFYWYRNMEGAAQVEEWLANLVSELNSSSEGVQGG